MPDFQLPTVIFCDVRWKWSKQCEDFSDIWRSRARRRKNACNACMPCNGIFEPSHYLGFTIAVLLRCRRTLKHEVIRSFRPVFFFSNQNTPPLSRTDWNTQKFRRSYFYTREKESEQQRTNGACAQKFSPHLSIAFAHPRNSKNTDEHQAPRNKLFHNIHKLTP